MIVESEYSFNMQSDISMQLGQLIVVQEMADLELLTEVLSLLGEHLNLALAVESYKQGARQGPRHLSPVVRERLQRSVNKLRESFATTTVIKTLF